MRATTLILILLAAGWMSAQQGQPTLTPAYGAGFDAHADLMKQMLAELRGIRADLRLASGVRQDLSAATVITSRCASCHAAAIADEKGGSFVLVERDGKPADLTPGFRRSVIRQVEKNLMPPGAPLPEAEKQAIRNLKETPK